RVDTTLSKVAKELSDRVGIELTDELSGDQEYDVHSTGYAKPGQITQKGYEVPVDSARVRRDYLYKRYSSLPQSNKADSTMLEELLDKEPIDNLVMSGTDDNLSIKVRNFNQAPILQLDWNTGNRLLLSFKTGIKNNTERSGSLVMATDGWIPDVKKFIQGQVEAKSDSKEALGEVVTADL